MKIIKHSIGHFLPRRRYPGFSCLMGPYSLAGYSDAEWNCILGHRVGERTALGQTIDFGHGDKLLSVLQRRKDDPRFVIAVPECIRDLPGFNEGEIDWLLGSLLLKIEAVERDAITDDLAREAGLYPLIKTMREMRSIIVGPQELERTKPVLKWKAHVAIESPNLHMRPSGIEDAVERIVKAFVDHKLETEDVVVSVSAGVSAAVIIDQLHGRFENAWLLDVGSMWDAFAGIGGQREWRAQLYADPIKWNQWKSDCIYGKKGPR